MLLKFLLGPAPISGARCRLSVLVLVAGVGLPASVPAQTPAPPLMQFRIAASHGSQTPVLGKVQQRLLDLINTAAPDSMSATLVPPGEVVPVDKVLNAVANGSLEAAFTDPATWLDRDPAFALFSGLPLGAATLQKLAWMERGEGQRLMKELYAKFNLEANICGAMVVPAGLWSTRAIEKSADLIDLKVVADGLGASVMAGVGAKVSQLDNDKMAEALISGSVQAVRVDALSLPAQFDLAGEHAPYFYPQGWGEQTSVRVLIVSRQVWASMSTEQRRIVRSACHTLTVETLSSSQAARADAVAFLKEKAVNAYRWSPEVVASMEKSWLAVVEKLSKASEAFEQGWTSLSRFVAGSRAYDAMVK